MSTIKSSTTTTTAYQVVADTTGALVIQTGATPTIAVTVDANQNTTLAGYLNTPNTFGFKNRIINGAMVIDQRNAGASVTPSTTGVNNYSVDRWALQSSQASKLSIQQNAGAVTPPAGFTKYLGFTSLAATSLGAGDYFVLTQPIEGLNVTDFGFGTANATTITLQFWVRSSLTGTFGGGLQNSATNRSYPFSYTISSANTWEQKTITIVGDTSGTWLTTNGVGLYLWLGLGVGTTYSGTAGSWSGGNYVSATGATSVVGTNGATFYITGVQLEKGSTATSFDYRPYGTELMLCQRYLPAFNGVGQFGVGFMNSATTTYFYVKFPVSARVAPTGISYSNLTHFSDIWSGAGQSFSALSLTTTNNAGTEGAGVNATTSGGTTNAAVIGNITNTAGQLLFTGCEL
jgi:hypothetical protein